MSTFFPEDDKFLDAGDYFKPGKIKEGESVNIRIISDMISGWEVWTKGNKPVRFRAANRPRSVPNAEGSIKPFRAMLIWNYDLKMLQIWSFSQLYLRDSFQVLVSSKGDPKSYDISVTRFGKDTDTRYFLKAFDPKPIDKVVKYIVDTTPVNLCALYVGKEPFIDLEAGKEEESNDASVA